MFDGGVVISAARVAKAQLQFYYCNIITNNGSNTSNGNDINLEFKKQRTNHSNK